MRLYADNGDGLSPIERVLPRLQRVRKCGKGWSARCPAHNDRKPSLTIGVGDDNKVLLNCHAGCSYAAIMTAMGLQESDGFAEENLPALDLRASGLPPHKITCLYDYRDEQGNTLYQTVRFEPKDFRQRHQNGSGQWVWNLVGTHRVLYRLPELLVADCNEPVWLVEGEKDADNLANLGLIATTSPMGAQGWRKEYAEFLRNRHVIIVPDNDPPGHEYAGSIIKTLRGIAASVNIILLPGLPPSGDVSDWLADGHTKAELTALAVVAEDADTVELQREGLRYTLHWLEEAFGEEIPVEWIVNGLFQRGSINLLHGAPGTKKTYALLDLSMCLVEGKQWLGRDTVAGTVLLIDEESGPRRLRRRLREVARGHDTPADAPLAYTTLEMFDLLNSKDDTEHIDNLMANVAPALVIVDALADIMPGGDENEVKDTHLIFQKLKYLAHRHNCCVVVIHHSNRAGGYRGSSAIPGVVDVMLKLESKPRTGDLLFTIEKNRDGEEDSFGAEIVFDKAMAAVCLVSQTATRARQSHERASIQHVLEYLKTAGGGAYVDDIVANPAICSPAAARAAIYVLARQGRIARTDKGGRGSRAYYELIVEEN